VTQDLTTKLKHSVPFNTECFVCGYQTATVLSSHNFGRVTHNTLSSTSTENLNQNCRFCSH
jgi:biotin synthase-like enzyme